MMDTNYDLIAKEYQVSKLQAWRQYIEAYTYFQIIGDLSGLRVLDLACGGGFYSRIFKLKGASKVVGVDISEEMIRLARNIEQQQPLGMDYYVCDAKELQLHQEFDLVCASYLLNYAQSPHQLQQMGETIAKHLRPGGRFITINSNPDFDESYGSLRKYGFTRENHGTKEGDKTIYRFFINDEKHIDIINYQHSKQTHQQALQAAGLSDVRWHPVNVSPEGIDTSTSGYWDLFLRSQPVIGLSSEIIDQ